MRKRYKDSSIVTSVVKSIILVVLLFFAISYIALLVWGFLTSLKSKTAFEFDKDIFGLPNFSEPEFYLLKNYTIMLKHLDLVVNTSYYNAGKLVSLNVRIPFITTIFYTIVYVLGTALISTFITCIVAYMCSRYTLHRKEIENTLLNILLLIILEIKPWKQ